MLESTVCLSLETQLVHQDPRLLYLRAAAPEASFQSCMAMSWLGRDMVSTLPETNMAPENQWLEDEFPLGRPIFKGYVSFREGIR